MKKKRIQIVLGLVIILITLLAAWIGVIGINKTVDKSISVDVYETPS